MAGSKKQKNKRSSSSRSEDKVSSDGEYGQELVGSRVKVWWPYDRKFYKGVVESYLSNRKKHRIWYDDGDRETLNLKKEVWELLEADEEESSEGTAEQKPSSSSEDGEEKEKAKSFKSRKNIAERNNLKERPASSSKDFSVKEKPMTDEVDVDDDETVASYLKRKKLTQMIPRKENGEENEKPKPLKSGKKVAEPYNLRKRPSSSSSKPLSVKKKLKTDDGDDEVDLDERSLGSFLKRKNLTKMAPTKENGEQKEKPKFLKSGKNVAEPNDLENRPSSSSKTLSVEKKPRTDDSDNVVDFAAVLVSIKDSKKPRKMTTRKKNCGEKEKTKSSSKNVVEPNNLKNMPSSSSKTLSIEKKPRTDDGDNEVDVKERLGSFLDPKKLKEMIQRKENGEEKEKQKSLKSVDEPNNLKKRLEASSSNALSVKEKPKTDDGDIEVDIAELLVSIVNKTPEALKASVEKAKMKENKKAGEGSSPNETEMEEE